MRARAELALFRGNAFTVSCSLCPGRVAGVGALGRRPIGFVSQKRLRRLVVSRPRPCRRRAASSSPSNWLCFAETLASSRGLSAPAVPSSCGFLVPVELALFRRNALTVSCSLPACSARPATTARHIATSRCLAASCDGGQRHKFLSPRRPCRCRGTPWSAPDWLCFAETLASSRGLSAPAVPPSWEDPLGRAELALFRRNAFTVSSSFAARSVPPPRMPPRPGAPPPSQRRRENHSPSIKYNGYFPGMRQ